MTVRSDEEVAGDGRLGFFRTVCALAAVSYPAFGFVFQLSVPGARDSIGVRALLALLPAALVSLSYAHAHFRRRMLVYLNVLFYILLGHQLYLIRVNQLAPSYALGFLLAWAAVGACHVRLDQLVAFLVVLMVSAAGALWGMPAAQLPVSVFLSSLVILSAVLVASLYARIRFEGRVAEANVRLSEEIAGHRRTEEELKAQTAFFEEILGNVNAEIVVLDLQFRYRFISPSAVRDPSVRSRLLNHDDFDYCRLKNRPRALAEGRRRAQEQALRTTRTVSFEEEFVDGNGLRRHYLRSMTPIRDAAGRVVRLVGSGIDITERKITERAIQYMAYHDSLTGLPGREKLQEEFRSLVARVGKAALFFLDLDRFKITNDTLGHTTGDQMLSAVAGRLARAVKDRGTVYRHGGDQFIVLCAVSERGAASTIARDMLRALRDPVEADGHQIVATAGIGIARFPEDGPELADLIRHAELAMRRAKGAGQNTFHFVRAALKSTFARRTHLLAGLRRALEQEELEVFYQPRVLLETREIVGAEALIRWNHPELGQVGPDEFIPLMEESGRIHELGEFVLRTACRQLREWGDEGFPDLGMSVNCSSTQLRRQDFPERVARILRETGLDPQRLELEITEGVLMDQASPARRVMHHLRDQGIGFSIDDFGTGFSSLSYLRHLPVDSIKIDRSFLREVPGDADSVAIVTAIATMAISLGLGITAEGVEREEQLYLLRELACSEVQGYLFGRPMRPADLSALLERQ